MVIFVGIVLVNFDNGKIGTYRCGESKKYEVVIVNEPRTVPLDYIEIGCTVQRGKIY